MSTADAKRRQSTHMLCHGISAIVTSLLCACAVQRVDVPKAWTQITDGQPSQCPEVSGKYPDIPEFSPSTAVYPENYPPIARQFAALLARA